jgi:hypothetical protein
MTALLELLHVFSLASRLVVLSPSMTTEAALAHARAATAAASARISPELLLGVAFIESRFDPTATSRVERGVRHTGSYPRRVPPVELDPHTSLYCGPLQTYAGSWRECLAQRELDVAYAAGARELSQWLRDPRVRGNLALALAGHGCGNAGVATGRCNGYPLRVLGVVHQLERGTRTGRPPRPVIAQAPTPPRARLAPRRATRSPRRRWSA